MAPSTETNLHAMTLHPQAALAIEKAGTLPVSLTPPELRRAYVEQRMKMLPPAPRIAVTYELSIPSPDGPIRARFYRAHADTSACPLLVYFHGGGWMLGTLESYDTTCRRLAVKARCAVVSVDYRLSPETRFPGAVHDAYAATLWCVQNAARLGINPASIAVGGDSSGGNLAAVVAQMSLDRAQFRIASQVLIYPATDLSREWPSYERNGSGYMLTSVALRWLIGNYIAQPQDRLDVRASPMLRANFADLPRALIIAAEFDPLVDENEAYAKRLEEAGVPTQYVCFPGMIHAFFTLGGFIDDAARAEDLIAAELRALA
jgi:acetyl esterase